MEENPNLKHNKILLFVLLKCICIDYVVHTSQEIGREMHKIDWNFALFKKLLARRLLC